MKVRLYLNGVNGSQKDISIPDDPKKMSTPADFVSQIGGISSINPHMRGAVSNAQSLNLPDFLTVLKQYNILRDEPENKDFFETYSLLPVEGVKKSQIAKAFRENVLEMPGGKGIYLRPKELFTDLQALQSYTGNNPAINNLKDIDLNNADLNAVLNNLTQAGVTKAPDTQQLQTAYNNLDQDIKVNDRTKAIANEQTYQEQQENLNKPQYIQDLVENPEFKKTNVTATDLGKLPIKQLKDLHTKYQNIPETQPQVRPQQSSSSSQQQAPAQFGNNNTSSSSSSGFQPIEFNGPPVNRMAQYLNNNTNNNNVDDLTVDTSNDGNPQRNGGFTAALFGATQAQQGETEDEKNTRLVKEAEDKRNTYIEKLRKETEGIKADLYKKENKPKTSTEIVEQMKREGVTESGKPLEEIAMAKKARGVLDQLGEEGHVEQTEPNYGPTVYDKKIGELEDALNPLSEANKNRDQSQLDLLTNAYKSDLQQNAIKPYMEGMSGKPNQLLKQLTDELYGPYEKQLKDEAYDEFTNTILPKIRSQYMQPGVVHNGQMERAINHALEKYNKGLKSALVRGRREATQDVNQFLAQRNTYARTAQDAAKGDMLDKLGLGAQIEQFHKGSHFRENQALQQALDERKRIHEQNNAINQWKNNNNVNKQNWKLAYFNALLNASNPGAPTQQTYMPNNPYQPDSNYAGSAYRAISGVGAGLSSHMFNNMNKSYKTGGRVHKAEGGQINPNELLVESHFTGLDPLKALEKQMKQRAIMGFLADRNQQRQAYAEGGRVDPIQQGAQKAEEYAGHSEIRKYIQKLQNPPQRSGFTNLVNDVMTALHNTPGHHFMKGPAAAYTSVVENVDKREKANQDREASIANLEYKLGQDIEKKRLEHEKMANQRSMQNELLQTQRDIANAKIGNMREISMMKGEQQPLKLNRAETNTLDEAVHSLKAAEPFIQKIDHLKDVISRIETGSNTLRSGWGETGKGTLSSWRLGVTGHKGSMEDYDLAHKGLTDLANDIGSTFGKSSRIGIGLLKLIHQGKANLGMEKGAINEILDQMKKKVQEEAKLSENIIDNVDLGVAPSHSVAQFVKASRQPRAPETSSPAIKTNTFTPEKNERLNDLQNFFNRDAYQTTKWLGK